MKIYCEFNTDYEPKLASKEKIFLSSGRFELLPCLDIKTLYDNTDFKSIVNTLIHEMGHLNDWLAMPNLYECVFDCQNKKHYLIALFWLEYIAESRTANLGLYDYTSYCKDVASELWDIQMCSLKPEEFKLERLKGLGTFDDVTLLYDLYDIQNKYYKVYLAK